MWEKGFRIITFAALYDAIYWGESFEIGVVDLDAIAQAYKTELDQDQKDKVIDLVNSFLSKKETFYEKLQKYTNSWDKTYDIVKATMCTALLELEEVGDLTTPEQKKKIVNKYVQIVQDMVGGNNPNLVYAIVGKLFGV
jgi:transcription termination factor NusB